MRLRLKAAFRDYKLNTLGKLLTQSHFPHFWPKKRKIIATTDKENGITLKQPENRRDRIIIELLFIGTV